MRINFFKNSLLILLSLLFFGCNQKNTQNDNQTEIDHTKNHSQSDYFSFVEEVLIGFEMPAIAKHMIHTPYKYLGENEGRMNYEGMDKNQVNHFVSFAKYSGETLQVYVYNIDFKNNNENLLMGYQEELRSKLEAVYGQDFETGYNEMGNFTVEWTLEGVLVDLTYGTNFITLEVNEH
jgi:hypothetical protein